VTKQLKSCFTKELLHTGKGMGGVENMTQMSRFDALRKRNEYFYLYTDHGRYKVDRSGIFANANYFDKLLFKQDP
jgi:hypothetical protein